MTNDGPIRRRAVAAATGAWHAREGWRLAPGDLDGPEAALTLINARFALQPVALEDVELRRMALANDALDRTHERFSVAFLERLAATLPGKPVLAHHDKSAWPLGRFFAAYLARDADGTTWLMARWYLLKTVENAALRRQIDAGIFAHVSIGFRGGELTCDLCGQPFWSDCPHWPGQEVVCDGASRACTMTWEDPRGTAEAVEGSLVWLGAQRDARHVKAAQQSGAREPVTLEGGEPSHSRPGGASLQFDGQLYRDDLVDEIQRLAGLLEANEEATLLTRALRDTGAAALKRLRDEYQRRVDARFPPVPTGRAAPPAGPERPDTPRDPRAHTLI